MILTRKVEKFVDEIYNHYKTIGYLTEKMMQPPYQPGAGVESSIETFIESLAKGQHFEREDAIG